MSTSEVNRIYDAAKSFRAPGLAALTADATIGVLPLDKLVNVRPSSQRNKLGAEKYEVVIVVSSVVVSGGETYALNVDVGATGAANVRVGSVNVAKPGQYIVTLDAQTIENINVAREEIALKLDVTGAGSSIVLAAWIV